MGASGIGVDWNLLGLKLGIIAKARLRTASLARHKEEEEEARVVCVFSFFLYGPPGILQR